VVGSFGRHCLVESPDGQRRICHARGKKAQAVVGDRVQWRPSHD
jgi:ribosome biogenesis GTPase / thiamine phosphate phosphatase